MLTATARDHRDLADDAPVWYVGTDLTDRCRRLLGPQLLEVVAVGQTAALPSPVPGHGACAHPIGQRLPALTFNFETSFGIDGARCDCIVVPVSARKPDFTNRGTDAAHH